jgi:multidrug resistance efflux pump
MIADAFEQLEIAANRGDASEAAPAAATSPVLGQAAGTELRHQPTFLGRLIKSISGIAILLLVGVIPLERVLTPSSDEAFVNAPVYLVLAPAAGRISETPLEVGMRVAAGQPLAVISGEDGTTTPVHAPEAGKVWEFTGSLGDVVAAGQPLGEIAACNSASVTASVSAAVYDRLRPGMPARFNFFGERKRYAGIVAKLMGHSVSPAGLAISSQSLLADTFHVFVSVPDLGEIPDCAVGRRGEVIFGRDR